MAVALTLLDDVRWRGATVAGERPRALLAALAASGGRAVADERLIALVWGDELPANATKSLQVLVSRTRTACGADAIVREGDGYRLGVAAGEVDSARLAALVREAAAALDEDAATAAARAGEALALAPGAPAHPDHNGDALSAIRRAAAADVAHARAILAQARSRLGAHGEALPQLEQAHAARPDDESLLADLLRSEAVVRGPAAALERYEGHRRELRDRLGAAPGERLQRVQRELLALDRPVRRGVRYDATRLVGREPDVAHLKALLATARVVSIVGAGGLGKTRLAHVLARDAAEPVVHVVELAGVTAPEDVVGEVGSALGVRDSISGRRSLTPAQRADLRGRIAQRLGQSPSLLVLDNCEHLIEAVAKLVAFLVSATADLRVLTTSRAPLAIAAERVYRLGELDAADAAQLFRDRALAVRPGAQLDEDTVRRIVTRLDGLPLAIELAAAKTRAMAAEEIDRRLENRFALLRGGDRSAPDRHRTLLAVIDWSWNLLDGVERRALRRLALFNDGFTLPAAESILGDDALAAVQGLADQSLLTVREEAEGVRYRMLETVREFGRMQLVDAGEDADARAARRRWACAYATAHGPRLAGREQFAAMDAIAAEETNLADELRDALADGDPAAAMELLSALGLFWMARGEHGRLFALSGAIAGAVGTWRPEPEHEATARAALAISLGNALMTADQDSGPIREALTRLGPGDGEPRIAGMVRVVLAFDPDQAAAFSARLEGLAEDPDPSVAAPAQHWLSHVRENAGDPAGAIAAAERALALADPGEGPWLQAILRTQLAQLLMHMGDRDQAVAHARAALPVMRRLGARDDALQLWSLLALDAISAGRLEDAEADLERLDRMDDGEVFGGAAVRQVGRAELMLARGDAAGGLRAYRDSAATLAELRFPGIELTGLEPWALFGKATTLTAHAHHAQGDDVAYAEALFAECRALAVRALDASDLYLDCPVAGLLLFALGSWGLLRDAAPREEAVRALALAERFAYNRTIPTMHWERIAPRAEACLPGRLAELLAGYGDRKPLELVAETRALVEKF